MFVDRARIHLASLVDHSVQDLIAEGQRPKVGLTNRPLGAGPPDLEVSVNDVVAASLCGSLDRTAKRLYAALGDAGEIFADALQVLVIHSAGRESNLTAMLQNVSEFGDAVALE